MDTTVQGRTELARGRRLLAAGPSVDAYATFCLARDRLADDPAGSLMAAVAAVDAAWTGGDHPACVEALVATRRLVDDIGLDGPGDYVSGLLAVLTLRRQDGVAPLLRTIENARDDGESLRRAVTAALIVGRVESACRAGSRALAAAQAADDERLVARATEYVAYAELRAGRHALAREHALRGLRAAVRTGQTNIVAHHHAVLALVASVEGPVEQVVRHAEAALVVGRRHGLAQPVTLAQWALGRADLAVGRVAEAATRLGALLMSGPDTAHFALRGLVIPTYIEAAAGTEHRERALEMLAELAGWTASSADPQSPALLMRCRALMSADDDADGLFEGSDAAHRAVAGDFEHARTLHLHGKWLRRHRRAVDARERLRDAVALFERCGAGPWEAAARAEMRAAGAGSPAPSGDTWGRLTAQQQNIARCVAAGNTNREIAARLSVSVRTVDHHLRNIFVVLGVRSRVELARLVPAEEPVEP